MVAIVNIKCSLQDQCLTQNIVYQPDIFNNVDKEKRFNYAQRDIATMREIANMKGIAMQLNCQKMYRN